MHPGEGSTLIINRGGSADFFHQPTEPGTSLDPSIWYIFSAQPWKLEGFRAGVMTTIAINTVRLGRAGGQSGAKGGEDGQVWRGSRIP